MDISLSEGHRMLKASTRSFLSAECPKSFVRDMETHAPGYTQDFWGKIAALGWLGYVLPAQYSGGDGDLFNLGLIVEEMGYAAMPGPFFSTVVMGAQLILQAGSVEQKKAILPGIARGNTFLTVAFMEPDGNMAPSSIETTATRHGSNYILRGTKLFVDDAHIANSLICVARTGPRDMASDNISLFLVPTETRNIKYTALLTTTGGKQFEVRFEDVMVPIANLIGETGSGWPTVDKVLQGATALKCAEMVGGMQAAMDLTLEYSRERIAFGHPIGSFQAVHHHFADMYRSIETSRLLSYNALWRLSQDLPAAREVSLAKSSINRASGFVTRMAHQIYGGVGYYTDADLEIFSRRAMAQQASFGDTQFHMDRVATLLDLVGL